MFLLHATTHDYPIMFSEKRKLTGPTILYHERRACANQNYRQGQSPGVTMTEGLSGLWWWRTRLASIQAGDKCRPIVSASTYRSCAIARRKRRQWLESSLTRSIPVVSGGGIGSDRMSGLGRTALESEDNNVPARENPPSFDGEDVARSATASSFPLSVCRRSRRRPESP